MKSLDIWLDEYSFSHRHVTNKRIHFICVPLIFFTVIAFLFCVPLHTFDSGFTLTMAHVTLAFIVVYYLLLSLPIAIGMALYSVLCIAMCMLIQSLSQGNLVWIALGIFVVAWMFQFYGHGVEGKKPSFFKDIQFLMIGPAWVMTNIYERAGL